MDDIHKHGVGEESSSSNTRLRCIYCDKEMTGVYRLRCHLGNIPKDINPCPLVPPEIEEAYRQIVTAKEACEKGARGQGSSSRSVSVSPPDQKENIAVEDLVSQKCIGRFFYEKCVDLSAVDSPSFKEMMSIGGGGFKIPDSHDLKGWMLQEALKEVQDGVKKIKESWAITGCSILLDAWVDPKGRDLVTFIADSPAGPVYLNSFDVSDIKNDDNALLSLVNRLVEEAAGGNNNVTQIIAESTSGWVGELEKLFVASHKSPPQVFWSVSVTHWLELLLEKIGKVPSFEDILDKGNSILEFVNNKAPWVLSSHGNGIAVDSSEFVTPFLTLETIFKAKKNLKAMFASSSDWNKEEDGMAIFSLMNDSSFWESLVNILLCTYPLSCGRFTSAKNDQNVGCIYKNLKDVKKSIERYFAKQQHFYKPLLDVIDEVWKKHLQSPLHTAGYYLNPEVFNSNDYDHDQEVSVGITSSLFYIVKSFHMQVQILNQLEMYKLGRGSFNEARQADQISGISPTEWWAQKASKYPELQSFSIKILSQTCEGASRYKLKRSLAEKMLLTQGMSHSEKQHLEDLAFVHYNLHLQSQTKS
ncbi:hypothetical protein V5N11_017443 [Cardamine amara subsp. amara]|uniref:DUF659 domain-containing protein n=1 Tax=Cardamine amara subsp. amara TaxID=228776 RepID=A0ABD1ATB1_CARAN